MNVTDDEGRTRREHYEQVGAWWELEPPVEFPDLLEHVWFAFLEMHSARPSGGMGLSHFTFETFDSYMRVTGTRLAGWEVQAIKKLDEAWIKVQNEQR